MVNIAVYFWSLTLGILTTGVTLIVFALVLNAEDEKGGD